MNLTLTQQLERLLADKKNILITFHQSGAGDAIGSGVALLLFLESLGKKAEIVCPDFNLPAGYSFLKKSGDIKAAPGHLQKFIVTVDINATGIKELSYDVADGKLRIFITPKEGYLTREHIKTAESDFVHDLIIVLGTPDLDSLGSIYTRHTDFFERVPVVNIDNRPHNERFGHLNIVDITKSSVSELMFGIVQEIKPELVTKDIATALLTGMIAKTHSFTKGDIRPASLQTASKLVELGADRGGIIENLYKTKSIATFKLWGAALSHLQLDPRLGLAWSTLTRDDFVRAGAHHADLHGVVDELISHSPDARIILLLHEHEDSGKQNSIQGLLKVSRSFDALKILAGFNPTGDSERAVFELRCSLKEAEANVIEKIRAAVAQQK